MLTLFLTRVLFFASASQTTALGCFSLTTDLVVSGSSALDYTSDSYSCLALKSCSMDEHPQNRPAGAAHTPKRPLSADDSPNTIRIMVHLSRSRSLNETRLTHPLECPLHLGPRVRFAAIQWGFLSSTIAIADPLTTRDYPWS